MGERRQPPQASPRPRLCQGPPEGLLPVPCIPPSRPRPAAARGGPASASRPAREPQRARPPPSPQAGGRAGPGRPRPPGPAARGSAGRHRPLAAAERTAGGERGKAQLGPAARGDQGPGRHGEGLALQPPPSLLLPRPEPPGPAEPARPPSAGLAWGSAEPEPGPCGAVWGRPLAPRLRQDGLRGPASATLPSHSPGPARLRCCSGSAECALGSHKAACSGRELLLLQGWHACLGGGGRGGAESLHILFLQRFESKPCCSGESLDQRRRSPVSLLHQPFLSRRESAVQLSDGLLPGSACGSPEESCRLGHCGASSWFR